MQAKKSVDDVWPVAGKRFLLRAEFNVPMRCGSIDDDFRIRSVIPTIRRIIDHGGICIIVSHLGRPVGVDYDTVAAEQHKRRMAHHFPGNRGKAAFFSSLRGESKALILSWSSQSEKAATLTAQRGSGKTAIFARLPDEEKRYLLLRFLSDHREEVFPQLGLAAGYEEEHSLQMVAIKLAELLDQHVYFVHDCLSAKGEIMKLRCGEVMLLENVRFYSNETSPDEAKRLKIARIMASYADVYINDAFGTAHRNSASITGIPKVMGSGAAGYVVEREINYFSKVLNNPPHPLVAIIGGAKLSDKVNILEHLVDRVDCLIIGGAMAYTFLKAQGYSIGLSYCEDQFLSSAAAILKLAKERHVPVYLPLDHVCHTEVAATDNPVITRGPDVEKPFIALDIGTRTIQSYTAVIAKAKSLVWNGPMGVFEIPCYAAGTYALAKVMGRCSTRNGLVSIAGGGDTSSAIIKCGEAAHFSHISTGGNASLELLEGKTLPGVAVLDNKE